MKKISNYLFPLVLVLSATVPVFANGATCIANSAVISSDCSDLTIDAAVSTAINNGVTVSGVTQTAVSVSASNAALNNLGLIDSFSASTIGLNNLGSNNVFINGASGAINGSWSGFYNNAGSSLGLMNLGSIAATNTIDDGKDNAGIVNFQGQFNVLSNGKGGSISGLYYGVENLGAINVLNNFGTMSGTLNPGEFVASSGIFNGLNSVIGTITNYQTGVISSSTGSGIANYGQISVINNSGVIAGANGIINSGGVIGAINNFGSITSGASGIGIYNVGNSTITTLTNAGTISGPDTATGIFNETGSAITTLVNTGSIVPGNNGYGIINNGSMDTLTNSGSIVTGVGNSIGISNQGDINTLNNAGSIIVGNSDTINSAAGILNFSSINSLINTGSITSGTAGYGIINNGNGSSITTLINTGTIASGDGGYGIYNASTGTINTLTNMGSISSGIGGYGIYNESAGIITSLTNAQGGNGNSPVTTALTYGGALPTNYSIFLASQTHYGQLVGSGLSGATTFSIAAGSYATLNHIYSGVLQGFSASNLNNAVGSRVTGASNGYTYVLTQIDPTSGIWNLDVLSAPVNLIDTQQSLINTAATLQNTYALQNSVLANSFSYDCNQFGANSICISVGGRNTAVSAANGLNNMSGLLIAAYRPHQNYHIGAYVDQNLSVNNAGSTVSLGNNTPLIGLFGVWNGRVDGTGTEVKISAAYGQKNATISRQVVNTSEPGIGSSQLNSQGAQVTAKYGFGVVENVIVAPYVGIRYTQNNMGGYTEGASATVTAPLTYSALNTNATTALAGLGASYKFVSQAGAFGSVGVETDANTANGTYSATGFSGLTPINFNATPVKTRPTAMLGAYYDVAKNQRLGVTGIYRQEPFQAVSTTTVMATYTIGM
ncbi:autotransporter outer membrane beta-barrel domain-containing protein [Polynucleobacter sp. AP-Reno-20A-A9]|uniref:beta strand repeat-containing protein n=1 Tax=Polynucleobacter sp. AP-Reno-20A-A9 TaxID=2576925 RepID=UPI001C0E0DD0|nr:autotransporter outer membrane beta-barrel domain-containing protein [Polynucleobacter sp. AP-Reno-20A-A9]MBU3628142.1 hypothetical protein [Polynucleobacter sp. AP-Reno-20A-A9]